MVNRSGVGPAFARARSFFVLVLLFAGIGVLLRRDSGSRGPSDVRRTPSPTRVQALFARLPMSFEPNEGQTENTVKFLAHGAGYGVYLMPSKAVLTFPKRTQSGLMQIPLEMQLGGGNEQAPILAADRLPGDSNYLIGNDSSRWLHNVPQFSRVEYRGVYPGIDLAFYGNQNRLEYDFEVSPGSDARRIQLNFKGADWVSVAENGDLVISVDGREMRFLSPRIYQRTAAGEQGVAGKFVLRGENGAGFEIAAYDRSRTLVIDPVFLFSTYLGGSGDESCTAIIGASAGFVPHCPAITVDSAGNIYVAGTTNSSGSFAGVTPNPISGSTPNPAVVYVARMSFASSASSLAFVTYIGGAGTQYPVGIGVDSGFNVYVAGNTDSSSYPVTGGAYQSSPGSAGYHAFVTQLDSTGTANKYSTYISGNGVDTASDMAIDSQGRVYLMGTTTSSNFPTTIGALQSGSRATNQFFFSKLNTGQSGTNGLLYSTYIGGSNPAGGSVVGGAIAVDSSFNVYLAGGTNFIDMPVLNGYTGTAQSGQSTRCGLDVWAARLAAPATNIQQYTATYETYFGDPGPASGSCPSGAGDDVAYGVATDGSSTYITGSTTSTDITVPNTTSAFQGTSGGAGDAFAAKFGLPTTSGTTTGTVPLDYFSYLGGSGADAGLAITADSLGNARVTGFTNSANFPVTPTVTCPVTNAACNPLQTTQPGGTDAFVARLSTTGTSTATAGNLSGYLGGSATDIGTSIALDASLNMYVTGETFSPAPTFPTQNPLPTTGASLSGTSDAFVTVVGPNASGLEMPNPTPPNTLPAAAAANPTVSPGTVGVGSPITFTYYIYNYGDPVPSVVFTDTLGAGSGSTSGSPSQGSCQSAVSSGTLTCPLGTVNSSTQTSTTSGGTTTVTTNYATKVTVTVTAPVPSTPLTSPLSIGNSAVISPNPQGLAAAFGTAIVNDFSVAATLAAPSTSSTIPSGGQLNYAVNVTPTGAGFPESVTLTCGSGVPSGATCTFTNNPIPNMSGGPQSRALAIATTARVTTTAGLRRRGPFYAIWLPVLGLGVLGSGFSRRRKLLLGLLVTALCGTVLFQAGCSSSSNSSTTTGTPAGTYTVVINAASGSATRSTSVQFTVQ